MTVDTACDIQRQDCGTRGVVIPFRRRGPFASDWKPLAVALGVIATWLLIAVEVTSLVMKRLLRRIRRAIHFSSYAVFLLASFHSVLAGTDRAQWLYQITTVASIVAVAWATVYRLTHRRQPKTTPRVATAHTTVNPASPMSTR